MTKCVENWPSNYSDLKFSSIITQNKKAEYALYYEYSYLLVQYNGVGYLEP